jgi:hypothetical protein
MKMLKLILFGCLLEIAFCGLLYAQSLMSCTGIDQTADLKVVVDKLEYMSETGETKMLTKEYEFDFLLDLRSRLQNLFPGTQIQPVLCANRSPKFDGSDFMPDLVETLNNRNVLVEVWGTINSGKQSGVHTLGAKILIIIIPIRYYEQNAQLAFHMLSYPKAERGDLEIASRKLVFGTEFDVYTSIAYGMKELKNRSYDKAKKYFSNASIKWKKALEKGTLAETATDKELILEYIKQMEQKTITSAAADPNYRGDLAAVSALLAERGR